MKGKENKRLLIIWIMSFDPLLMGFKDERKGFNVSL